MIVLLFWSQTAGNVDRYLLIVCLLKQIAPADWPIERYQMKVSREGGRWVQDKYPIPNSLDENVMSYYLWRKPLVPRRSEGS